MKRRRTVTCTDGSEEVPRKTRRQLKPRPGNAAPGALGSNSRQKRIISLLTVILSRCVALLGSSSHTNKLHRAALSQPTS